MVCMAVHTVWNTLNACKYRCTCDCRADRSQHRVSCNWNNYQPSHSIYVAQTEKQTNKQTWIVFCYCNPIWYRPARCGNSVLRTSDTDRQGVVIQFWEHLSTSCNSHTTRTSNQQHEAVHPEILRFVQMQREPLPIMEPKVSKHPSKSSSHKTHNSNRKDQMSSKYPALKPVTKHNLQTVLTNCPSPYHSGIHGEERYTSILFLTSATGGV